METGPIGLKFFVRADFGHPVAHTKFQPLRLKDAEDIGWCVRNASGARGFHRTVTIYEVSLLAASEFEIMLEKHDDATKIKPTLSS